ncbi:MAG: leucine-rich repeat domain-containing protein [Ruminococcus sp.]|nr:leucine-rich repeat domain-containing protein [Ruminococcus sp.]
MKKMSDKNKKLMIRIVMFVMAILMILAFVALPLSQVSAEEDNTDVSVESFETGKLAQAIEIAKDGTDLNLIKRITVSGGVLNPSDYSALCGYPNLEYIFLSECETENGIIPDNALASRNKILYISLPKNTVTIGSRAFSGNRTLLKISVPDTVRNIGDYAFEGCESAESFSFPAQLETIGVGAFSDCKALTGFALPEAVTEIPDRCFSKCSFTELHLGPQVKKIGSGAFSDCHSLTDIYYYGKTAPVSDQSAFQNLKVTIHTYEGGEGFDSLESNFVSVNTDLSEDSVYIPPQSAETAGTDPAYSDSEPASSADTESTAAETEAVRETDPSAEAAAENKEETDTAAAVAADVTVRQDSGFSGLSVAIIAVLCAALAVTVTLLVVNTRKKR